MATSDPPVSLNQGEQDSGDLKDCLSLVKSGRAVLFVGAGLGISVGGPSGTQLATDLAQRFKVSNAADIRDTSQEVLDESIATRAQLEEFLREKIGRLRADGRILELCALPWSSCFTTNFDPLVAEGFQSKEAPKSEIVFEDDIHVNILDRTRRYVFYLMGKLDSGKSSHVVLTRQEYEQGLVRRKIYFFLLTEALRDGCAVFLGYSFQDRIVFDILRDLESQFGPDSLPPIYAFFPDPLGKDTAEARKFARRNVRLLKGDIGTFLQDIRSKWDSLPDAPHLQKTPVVRVNKQVVTIEPTLVADLGPYVELLTPSLLDGPSSVSKSDFFLRETNSWIPFKENWDFRRDVQNEKQKELDKRLLEELSHRQSKDNNILFIRGDPGTGKSTTAKRVAFDMAFHQNLPTFFIRDLGFSSKHEAFDAVCGKILAAYSDLVQDPGRGEEVKFVIILDDIDANPIGALRLYNYLTGNGRPLLMVGVTTGHSYEDSSTSFRSFGKLLARTNFYGLSDNLSPSEIVRFTRYLTEGGYWHLSSDALRVQIETQQASSFYSTLYSLVEPTRPPLTQVQRELYQQLQPDGKRLYDLVALFHQFGFEPPFELIRRAHRIPALELSQLLSSPTGKQLLTLREVESGPFFIRTMHHILASNMISTFLPSRVEQAKIIGEVLSNSNFGSVTEREFSLSFLIRTCGHRAPSIFSLNQRIEIFERTLATNEDQVLLHHLALLVDESGDRTRAKTLINQALARGSRSGTIHEEAPEVLMTSLAGLLSDEALELLRERRTGEGEAVLLETRSVFEQIRLSHREIGHALHREALLDTQLARLTLDPQEQHRLWNAALALVERGLDLTGEEMTRIALLELQSDLYRSLGMGSGTENPTDELLRLGANNSIPAFAVSSMFRRIAAEGQHIAIRKNLLEIAEARVDSGLRSKPQDTALLREKALLCRELNPTSFQTILNTIQSYLAQEAFPAPLLLFYAGVCSFELGYFDTAREHFDACRAASSGYRDRSRIRAQYVDERGNPVTFDGIVSEKRHAKRGRVRITGPEAKGQEIGFAPIGFSSRTSQGDMIRFHIVFSFRGPEARPI